MDAIIDLEETSYAKSDIFSHTTKTKWQMSYCIRIITLSDTVVSNCNGRGYYHKTCAEKLHIL